MEVVMGSVAMGGNGIGAARAPLSSRMSSPNEEYRAFIDELANRSRSSVSARWVREGRWRNPNEPEYQALLESLAPGQRELLAKLLDSEHQGGVHTALATMTDLDIRLQRRGVELAHEPTGSPSFYDYVCRVAGDEWPKM